MREHTSRFGELFECLVTQEIYRLNCERELDFKISYWHSNTNLVVDLVLSRGSGDPLAAIEIKSDTQPDTMDWKGLIAFSSEYPTAQRFCLCRSPHPYKASDGTDVLPWLDGLEQVALL